MKTDRRENLVEQSTLLAASKQEQLSMNPELAAI